MASDSPRRDEPRAPAVLSPNPTREGFRWKSSISKLLYKEFMVFVVLYAVLSFVYQQLLTEKCLYTKVAQHCNSSTDLIPMSFFLGFYITLIVKQWWAQYTSIPLPGQFMCIISSNVHRKDEKGRMLWCTLIRYANLLAVLILRPVSTRVLKRFPTLDHVVEEGFMTQDERKKFESLHSDFNKCWIPCVWFTNLVAQARWDGRIHDDVALHLLTDELNLYRAKCSVLFHYDWIRIPLLYTQVVTIAIYSFFTFHLIRWQFLKPLETGQEGDLDRFILFSTLLQFFYTGWLKVAEQIINPFGEDNDDFETNKLIDRNLQVSLLSMDDTYQNLPPAMKDKYWNKSMASPPHAMATAAETLKPSFLGSTFNMRMGEDAEQTQPVEASPSVLCTQTPLLSHFFTAASPATSIKNFGWGSQGHPHLQCPRADGVFPSPYLNRSKDRESVACIKEDETEDEATSHPFRYRKFST
ncbi:PREDICTED: LOW QUALITY PROTEIN: bestrophin-4 [Charadrius vociferus]|uniref:LOW QUALITY PROTEIN: bestrophin-4 n=1 Tax=Charadrius vociferus TaxID=50402 RepID=UPI0005212150|nr:PREDICTED: LOW QUALITY PROTEIN: bestrophin-4 [Charadrius vociferus]